MGVLTTNTGVTSLSTIAVILMSPVFGLITNIPYGARSIPTPEMLYVIGLFSSQSDRIYNNT